jgi:hypothetical protein
MSRCKAPREAAGNFSRRKVSSRTPGCDCSTVKVSVRLDMEEMGDQLFAGFGLCSFFQLMIKISATPVQMAESATLKAGKSNGS